MYLPTTETPVNDSEIITLRNYLEVQLDAVRDATHGLTEEQARSRPLRSALSLAGIMKHCAWVMQGALLGAGMLDDAPIDQADFVGSFTLEEDTPFDELRALFVDLEPRYLDMVAGVDLDHVMPLGAMPWYGLDESVSGSLRYLVVHHVEEFARHAGHADIIREEIDGATAIELNAAVEGRPANDFVTPWTPTS